MKVEEASSYIRRCSTKETEANTSFSNISFNSESSEQESLSLETKIISSIAKNMEEIIFTNYDSDYVQYAKDDIFFTNEVFMISLEDYLKRIYYSTKMDINTLIMAIIYIDKMCEDTNYILCWQNIHRLILAGCILSIQFNEDICFPKHFYAQVGSVTTPLLNELIYQLFEYMDFSLFIKEDYFNMFYKFLSK